MQGHEGKHQGLSGKVEGLGGKCGQQTLLWLPQEGPGKAGYMGLELVGLGNFRGIGAGPSGLVTGLGVIK